MFDLRIYIRINNGKRFFIPAPAWLVKVCLGMGGFGVGIAKKHIPEDQISYLENISFKELKKAVDVLKAYKGLNMIDVKTKDGTEIKIII